MISLFCLLIYSTWWQKPSHNWTMSSCFAVVVLYLQNVFKQCPGSGVFLKQQHLYLQLRQAWHGKYLKATWGPVGSTHHYRCDGIVLCTIWDSSAALQVPDRAVRARGIYPFTAMYRIIGDKINVSAWTSTEILLFQKGVELLKYK